MSDAVITVDNLSKRHLIKALRPHLSRGQGQKLVYVGGNKLTLAKVPNG